MKKILTLCLFGLLSCTMQAQLSDEARARLEDEAGIKKHLDFFGISIEGNIDDVTDRMQKSGQWKLKRKQGSQNQYIFEGPLFGYNAYVQVAYTRKTRTVFRMTVTPQTNNLLVWQDSLTHRMGKGVLTEQGTLWQRPEGMILYYTPEGYDTTLIFLDAQGNAVFKEEK